MTTTRPGTTEEPTALQCSQCDEPIAECELTLALGETMAQPHVHGG